MGLLRNPMQSRVARQEVSPLESLARYDGPDEGSYFRDPSFAALMRSPMSFFETVPMVS